MLLVNEEVPHCIVPRYIGSQISAAFHLWSVEKCLPIIKLVVIEEVPT